MSGQPYKNASDPEKYRNQYLETLGLRASVDKMNFDANQVYKQTGQLPAVSQMQDTRTTTEKLADIQGTRIDLIKELKPIADPQFAQIIIQKVEQSPLNSDGSLYTFLIQTIPTIVKELQKSYKYKIKGDMNDAETIVKYIENIYANTKDLSQSVKSFFSSYNTTQRLKSSDLSSLKEQYNIIINKLIGKIDPNSVPGGEIQQNVREINRKIVDLGGFLNSELYIDMTTNMNTLINNYLPNATAAEQRRLNELVKLTQELIEKLPKPVTLQTLLQQIEKSEKNINPSLTLKILQNFNELLPEVEPRLIELSTMFIQHRMADYNAPNPIPNPVIGGQPPANIPPDNALHMRLNQLTGQQLYDIAKIIKDDTGEFAPIEQEHLSQEQLQQYVENYQGVIEFENSKIHNDDTTNNIYEVLRLSQPNPLGIHGLGIRRKGRPKGSGIKRPFNDKVDKSKGIQPYPVYISFGKHLINTKKLNDGIVSIKTSKGSGIPTIQSRKVSDKFSKLIKHILGGGIVDNSHIKDFSPEEQMYLYKISKCSDISDKLAITSPSKDQEEKDFNQFEIMKGEIMSGNDSKELIRKFKALLIKFSRDNKLPKSQVSEILSELVEMGY